MREVVEFGDRVYAIHHSIDEDVEQNKTQWYGEPFEPLQASRMHYHAKKEFRTHRHILNPRTIKRTQEAFIVIKGSLRVEIYEGEGNTVMQIGSLTAKAGDIILVYGGYHKLIILDNHTVAYEIKCGQFSAVYEDKEFSDV
jgi:cupin fold WbuC family metalloprotein